MVLNVGQLLWGQVSFIFGVGGNVFVLYATIFHNAIKLDKMSIWVIKNLAVVDLCNCVFVIIPAISNQYYEGKWVFGSSLCYFNAINQYTFIVANMLLINFLSFTKLLRCIYPLRNLNSSRLQRISVSASTILISLVPIIWTIMGLSRNLLVITGTETPTALKACRVYFRQTAVINTGIILGFAVAGVCNGIPCVTLVVITTILLVYAIIKTRRTINKKNVMMVILITFSFLLSFMPYYLYMSTHLSPGLFTKDQLDRIFVWAWNFTFLSSWSNPIIYLVMNKTFRLFVRKKIRGRKFSSRVDSQRLQTLPSQRN